MKRVGVEWWNTHCFKGDSAIQMFLIEKILDGGWIYRHKPWQEWAIDGISLSDIDGIVGFTITVEGILIYKHWKMKKEI